MANEATRNLARDMIVAWLQHTQVKLSNGDNTGKFIGDAYKAIFRAVSETQKGDFQ